MGESKELPIGYDDFSEVIEGYYVCSCDFHELFDDKMIAGTEGYLKHLNQYHVISLDITSFISAARRRRVSVADVPNEIVNAVHKELRNMISKRTVGESLTEDLIHCVEETGKNLYLSLTNGMR